MPALLERLLPGRHEPQLVQAQLLQSYAPYDQVAMVNRIERSTEQADQSLLRHRPVGGGRPREPGECGGETV